nr:uncharacterized protein LOC112211204 [Halyomorpha halys]
MPIVCPNNMWSLNGDEKKLFDISGFLKCTGAIDCIYIRLLSKYFPLNIQTGCEADLQSRNIVVLWPGSTHVGTIFHKSNLK